MSYLASFTFFYRKTCFHLELKSIWSFSVMKPPHSASLSFAEVIPPVYASCYTNHLLHDSLLGHSIRVDLKSSKSVSIESREGGHRSFGDRAFLATSSIDRLYNHLHLQERTEVPVFTWKFFFHWYGFFQTGETHIRGQACARKPCGNCSSSKYTVKKLTWFDLTWKVSNLINNFFQVMFRFS